jgi:hypothetical protein
MTMGPRHATGSRRGTPESTSALAGPSILKSPPSVLMSQDLRSFKQAEGSEGYAHDLVINQISVLSAQFQMYLHIGKVRSLATSGFLGVGFI